MGRSLAIRLRNPSRCLYTQTVPAADDAIREATLELLLAQQSVEFPSPQAVAERAGVDVSDVEAIFATEPLSYRFLLDPLIKSIDEEVRELPIHRNPTRSQQREALEATLRGCLANPQQVVLLRNMMGWEQNEYRRQTVDAISHQSGLRLIGSDHGEDPVYLRRVHFLAEFVGGAFVSHRHNMSDPDDFAALLVSSLGILNPPALDYDDPSPPRRL